MADLLKISLVGTLPSGEEWSVNPVWSIGGDFGEPTTPAGVAAVVAAINAITVPGGVTQMWALNTNLTGCRVEARSVSGVLENQAEGLRGAAAQGGVSTAHPFQTSWVTSLRTTLPGGSGRGRLFWPATGVVLQNADYRPSAATVTSTLSGVKAYLALIETAIETTYTATSLCVWSREKQLLTAVNQMQMGNILDVQRRRRDVLLETYSSIVYP